jgi:hypothetical protein
LGALGELNPQNELQPALAPDRNQILVKGMVSNPNLRSASVAPKTNGLVAAKLAELFGQTILGFLFCLHAISYVLEWTNLTCWWGNRSACKKLLGHEWVNFHVS